MNGPDQGAGSNESIENIDIAKKASQFLKCRIAWKNVINAMLMELQENFVPDALSEDIEVDTSESENAENQKEIEPEEKKPAPPEPKDFIDKFNTTEHEVLLWTLFDKPGQIRSDLVLFMKNEMRISFSTSNRYISDFNKVGITTEIEDSETRGKNLALSQTANEHLKAYLINVLSD